MAQRGVTRKLSTVRAWGWAYFYRYCLVGFPWFWAARPPGEPAMVAARRMVRRHFGRDHKPPQRALARVLTTTAWPFAVLVHLWQLRRFYGPEAMPIRRAPGAIWAAMRHNILPGEYYAYALWRPERRKNIDNYLYSHEAARIFKIVNRPLHSDPIDDKLAFHEMCKAHALPTPTVLAAFGPTGVLLEFESGQPPELDLFVKPRAGFGGHGVERFRWRGGAFESNCGRRVRRPDLVERLKARARNEQRTLLVQPNLSNHPGLGVEANGALATVRLVTGYSVGGDVTAIFSFISFARSQRITAQQGHVVLIDVTSGRLVPISTQNSSNTAKSNTEARNGLTFIAQKPAPILPDWPAALRYAKAAHRLCSNIIFIGWDFAFTHNGPVLLEGNANWSADEYQSISGAPLGHTTFAAVLSTWLRNYG